VLWSILISGIPERYHTVHGLLLSLLETQGVSRMSEVELLYLMDNKRRSVGAKRNDLLDTARGEYVSFIDDDDEVAPNYVDMLYKAIARTRRGSPVADVICFPQRAIIGNTGVIHECTYSLKHWAEIDPGKRRTLQTTDRPNVLKWTGPPAHTMVWRRMVALNGRFPDKQFGEDVEWVDAVCGKAEHEVQIVGEPLYIYKFNPEGSRTR